MPELLFKYKPLSTKDEYKRIYDIIRNNRLYLPTPKQLNDPLEGSATYISSGFAGCSIIQNADEEYRFLTAEKNDYRILSFSSVFNSPQMWAYYCNNYAGICLCYKGTGSFSGVSKVEYCSNKQDNYIDHDEYHGEDVMRVVLNKKQIGWRYEKEWRLIDKTTKKFFHYSSDELVGIIFGNELDRKYKHSLKETIPKNIPILITHPGLQTRSIGVLPYGYRIKYDGGNNPFLYNNKELYRYLFAKDRKAFIEALRNR